MSDAPSDLPTDPPSGPASELVALRRWRLVLGRFADKRLDGACAGGCLGDMDRRRDRMLDYLYGREYARRGLRRENDRGGTDRSGSLDPTVLKPVDWLKRTQDLFPRSVFETVRGHALERYGMSEILSDPKQLADIEPDTKLLGALMSLSGRGDEAVKRVLR